MKKITRLPLLMASLMLIAACASAPAIPDYSALPATGNADAGRVLFEQGTKQAQVCGSCHAIDGPAELGPNLQGLAARAGSRVAGQSAEVYLYTSIVRPNDFLVPGYAADQMPTNYGTVLTPQQLRDLVAYLATIQ